MAITPAPYTVRAARLDAPVDLTPVPIRRAAGLINRAVEVQTYAGSGAYTRSTKTAARVMLATMRRRGIKTVLLCCPFRDGVLCIG